MAVGMVDFDCFHRRYPRDRERNLQPRALIVRALFVGAMSLFCGNGRCRRVRARLVASGSQAYPTPAVALGHSELRPLKLNDQELVGLEAFLAPLNNP